MTFQDVFPPKILYSFIPCLPNQSDGRRGLDVTVLTITSDSNLQITSSSLCTLCNIQTCLFLHPFTLGSNNSLSTLLSGTCNLCSSLKLRDQLRLIHTCSFLFDEYLLLLSVEWNQRMTPYSKTAATSSKGYHEEYEISYQRYLVLRSRFKPNTREYKSYASLLGRLILSHSAT
jgi:hypothetical protein